MNRTKIISLIVVVLGMLTLSHFDIFPLFVFMPLFVFGICIELARVFRGELKSLVPILYDLGAISCIVAASYLLDEAGIINEKAIGLSLLCILGAIFIYSGTWTRREIAKAKR